MGREAAAKRKDLTDGVKAVHSVVEQIKKRKKKVVRAVFDIDDTLTDSRYRTLQLAKNYDQSKGTKTFASLTVDKVGHNGQETAQNLGAPSTVCTDFGKYWDVEFWKPESFTFDAVVDIGFALYKQCKAAGAEIIYLSGRIASLQGTSITQLQRLGFTDANEKSVICKASVSVKTTPFKSEWMASSERAGIPVAVFVTESTRDVATVQKDSPKIPVILLEGRYETEFEILAPNTPYLPLDAVLGSSSSTASHSSPKTSSSSKSTPVLMGRAAAAKRSDLTDGVKACQAVLEQIKNRKKKSVVRAVFDVDDTLADTRVRTLQIAKLYDQSKGTKTFASLTLDKVGHDGMETAQNIGAPAATATDFHKYWDVEFWKAESWKFDTMVEVGFDFCKGCKNAGAEIIYLTGRIASLLPATIAQLQRLGFTDATEKNTICKASLSVKTAPFKIEWMAASEKAGIPIVVFVTESTRDVAAVQKASPKTPIILLEGRYETDFDILAPNTPYLKLDTPIGGAASSGAIATNYGAVVRPSGHTRTLPRSDFTDGLKARANIIEDIKKRAARGENVRAVFDVDDTLTDTRERTLQIAKDFDASRQTLHFAELTLEKVGHTGMLTAQALGLPQRVASDFEKYWEEGFWKPECYEYDTAIPAGIKLANDFKEAGAEVIYLTGRIVGLLQATITQLERLKLPGVTDKTVVCKPTMLVRTPHFKTEWLERSIKQGCPVAVFVTESCRDISAVQHHSHKLPVIMLEGFFETEYKHVASKTPFMFLD